MKMLLRKIKMSSVREIKQIKYCVIHKTLFSATLKLEKDCLSGSSGHLSVEQEVRGM